MVRVLLALSVNLGCKPYHIDLTCAFIQEEYGGPRTLYMKQFKTFDGNPTKEGKVGLVVRNWWGTPNSLRTYARELQTHLTNHNYQQIASDKKVYLKRNNENYLIMEITIHNLRITTKSNILYQELIHNLSKKYLLKDLGEVSQIIR